MLMYAKGKFASCQRTANMGDGELKNEFQNLLLEKKERGSLSTGSSLEDDASSPRSIESDWSFSTPESNDEDQDNRVEGSAPKSSSSSSIVDGLLFEIYDRYHARDSVDSDNITECSTTSGSVFGGSFDLEDREPGEHWTKSDLQVKDVDELRSMVKEIRCRISMLSAKLVKQLKRRDKNAYKLQKNFDILTAILQAVSPKRRIDTRIRFSYIPQSGKKAFRQWLDAYKAVARLPQGVPAAWRKRLWLCLADHKLTDVDWKKTAKFCFNEKSNPDDDNLGSQIVKDLHRTGCGWFCNQDTPEERAVLKRVLLAYARWNKSVGYCQGFNVIAALILQVMERVEEDALKVMIYLVDHILPVNYFSNNLRALSVDMAVLRDLMRVKLPRLSKHLDDLQAQAQAQTHGGGTVYEPPLINVFTMQWFLTLFATCLPEETVLRVWDCILLEGSEVLLRVALAIWTKIGERLEDVETADEFYSTMGVVIQDVLGGDEVDGRSLTQSVYSLAPFPLPGLVELKEKYTYNIHPFTGVDQSQGSSRPGLANLSSDEEDDDAELENIGCLGVLMPFSDITANNALKGHSSESENNRHDAGDIASASPGVFATDSYTQLPHNMRQFNMRTAHRVHHELSYLQKQYARMRQMQQHAVVVFTEATVKQIKDSDKPKNLPSAINHLFVSATRRKKNLSKSPQLEEVHRSSTEESCNAEAKVSETELNIHQRDSRKHLNELFRGHKERKHDTNKNGSALKLKHTGLNGEVSSISVTPNEPETAKCDKPSVTLKSPVKTALVDSIKQSSASKNVPSNVEVLDRNSPSVFTSSKDDGRIAATKTARTNNTNSNLKPWMLEEDSRCTYPMNFRPFPQRNKAAPRSKVLYGSMSDKGSKKMEAFRARSQPINGVYLGDKSS